MPAPTLDEVGSADEFMRVVNTWNDSRDHVMEDVRNYIRPTLLKHKYHIDNLWVLFTNEVQLGKGVYGTAYKACVRDVTVKDDETCKLFPLVNVHTGAKSQQAVNVVVKTIEKSIYRNDHPLSGFDAVRKRWTGNSNPRREMIMGRLLNTLVTEGCTPHFPLLYEAFLIGESREGYAMELAATTITKYMRKLALQPIETQTQHIHTILFQTLQGLLAADEHYGFRHNDLHDDNVLISTVENTNYYYRIGSRYYKVPTHGFAVRIIDYGWASASGVFGEDDGTNLLNHSNVLVPSESIKLAKTSDVAIELFDALRFIDMTHWDAKYGAVHRSVLRELERAAALLATLSRRVRKPSISTVKNRQRVRKDELASSDLLTNFMAQFFSKFEVSQASIPSDATVFDTSAPIFLPNQTLHGYERHFLRVDSEGKLKLRKTSSSSSVFDRRV